MQIVILDAYSVNPGDLSWDALREYGTLSAYDRTEPEMVAQRIAGADVVFVNKCRITAEDLKRASRLKFICMLATGYDPVDIEAAREKGIVVSNIPEYSTDAVAQMTMALLLEICLNAGHHSREVRKGRWTSSPDFCFWDTPLIELKSLTMGIVGCGKIGNATARLATAFGMNVIGFSSHPHPEFCGRQVDSLENLLGESDVVSLHCPATEETRQMIRRETIAKMKDGAILLNTGRGTLLNEADVAEALNSGKLYALGADVVSVEPIRRSNPLLQARNCYLTPHIAWAPFAARKRLVSLACDNLRAFLAGTPVNVVNG